MQGAKCSSGVIHLLTDQWMTTVTPELQLLISDEDKSACGRLSRCTCLPRMQPSPTRWENFLPVIQLRKTNSISRLQKQLWIAGGTQLCLFLVDTVEHFYFHSTIIKKDISFLTKKALQVISLVEKLRTMQWQIGVHLHLPCHRLVHSYQYQGLVQGTRVYQFYHPTRMPRHAGRLWLTPPLQIQTS